MTEEQQVKKTIERYEAYRQGLLPRIENKNQLIEALKVRSKGLQGINKLRAIDEVYFEERRLLDLRLEFNRCNDWIENYTAMISRKQEPNVQDKEQSDKG
jgi:hypothetical protein